jgi:hypothetical protein
MLKIKVEMFEKTSHTKSSYAIVMQVVGRNVSV